MEQILLGAILVALIFILRFLGNLREEIVKLTQAVKGFGWPDAETEDRIVRGLTKEVKEAQSSLPPERKP